jgi:glycosyltransferase involved in cell wall biosynthesis
LAFASKSRAAQWFSEADNALSNSDHIPDAFYPYVWAAELAKGRRVLERDCRSGLGTMMLSDTAAECTGLDRDFEAVKYAIRNCYVEGKTRFLLQDKSPNYRNYDLIVSFNSDSSSPLEVLNDIGSRISGSRESGTRQNPKLVLGLDERTDLSALTRDIRAHHGRYELYIQKAEQPESILEYDNTEFKDAMRVIASIDFELNPDAAMSAKEQPKLDLVSIVIPTFNRADLIPEAINSSLNQTYKNTEIIVVDDGSTDETKKVVSSYGDKVRYYYKDNGGIGSALNYGIAKMNGRWFKWLSSDDVLTPDAVEVLVTHANSTGALVAYTDYDIIDGEGKFVESVVERHYTSYYEYAAALWAKFVGNGGSSLIEKSCFDDVGLFDEGLRSAEDYDWWLRACLLHGHRFFHIPKTTLKYRVHSSQLTSSVKHNAYVNAEKIRDKIKQKVVSADPMWWETIQHYLKLYAKQNQKGGIARRLLRRSLVHMPEGMRKSALKTWHASVKPRMESEE